jgi:hypothetical protein
MGPARTLLATAVVVVSVGSAASDARAQSGRAGAPTPIDDAPGTRVAADLGFTGNLSRGLVYRDLITSRGVLQAWTGPWGAFIQPYWLYSRVGTAMGRVTADNDIYVRVGAFRNLTRTFFVTTVNVYEHSLRRKVTYRDLFGGGAGANLVRRKAAFIAASAAVLGEVTDFDGERLVIGDDPDVEIAGARTVVRWAVRLNGRYKLAGDRLAIIHDAIVMPSFRDPVNDYRVAFTGAIDAPIAKGFSARVQADATRDGVIVEGTKHNALLLTFGVSYRGEWQRKPPAPAPPPPPPPVPAPAPVPTPSP